MPQQHSTLARVPSCSSPQFVHRYRRFPSMCLRTMTRPRHTRQTCCVSPQDNLRLSPAMSQNSGFCGIAATCPPQKLNVTRLRLSRSVPTISSVVSCV